MINESQIRKEHEVLMKCLATQLESYPDCPILNEAVDELIKIEDEERSQQGVFRSWVIDQRNARLKGK